MPKTHPSPGSMFIQQSTLEKLKCTLCKRYLSIFPIYKNPEGDAICGRCPIGNRLDFNRDQLYENAIEFQKFPCTNRESGCLEVLFPTQLAKHEKICRYMKHECPIKIYSSCTWQGNLAQILDHVQKKHPTFILNNCSFELDFVNNHSENYIMPYGEDLYVVTREGNSTKKTFAITVKLLTSGSNTEQHMYELKLESGSRAYSHSVLQAVGKRLELQGGIVNELLLEPVTIIATIFIKEAQIHNKSLLTPAPHSDKDDGLDYEQLKDMECPVCIEYMLPPIYQCEIGHSFCKRCKEQQTVCPTCRAAFQKTRNLTLEKIAMNMTFPCIHEKCSYKGKGKDMQKHEAACLFGPMKCPLKDYEDCLAIFPMNELYSHIRNVHYEYLLELDSINLPFDDSIEEDIIEGYILKHTQLLFKLSFMYRHQENAFLWSVMLLGPEEESAKFCYELEIIDNSGKNMRMYFKMACSFLTDQSETFNDLGKCIYLHKNQISKFIKNQLTYRILITKKY